MSEELFEYDSKSLRLRKRRRNVRRAIGITFRYLAAVLVFVIAFYFIFEQFFTTDQEKALIAKNAVYEKHYSEMRAAEKTLSERIAALSERDDSIYRQLFHTCSIFQAYSGRIAEARAMFQFDFDRPADYNISSKSSFIQL